MNVTSLRTSLANLQANFESITADPKPSYSLGGLGSESVSWGDYQRFLLDAIEKTQELIVACDPYWITTRHVL